MPFGLKMQTVLVTATESTAIADNLNDYLLCLASLPSWNRKEKQASQSQKKKKTSLSHVAFGIPCIQRDSLTLVCRRRGRGTYGTLTGEDAAKQLELPAPACGGGWCVVEASSQESERHNPIPCKSITSPLNQTESVAL